MDILVFDVNETLLDIGALDKNFEDIFRDARARYEWFQLILQLAFTATLTGAYRDFPALGRSALKMVAAKRQGALNDAQITEVLEHIKSLPPHPEVADALAMLRDAGFVLTALTQSPLTTVQAQIERSGLGRLFTRLFSADAVKRYKPAPEPYQMVATEMRCTTGDLRLIAAHAWDIEGAMRAGCKAAFIARQGQILDPDVPAPDIVAADLREAAVNILGTIGAS